MIQTEKQQITFERYPAYKDSGVEWIGEVPEGWDIWKVSHLYSRLGSGTTPTAGSELYYVNGSNPFLQTGDLNDGLIKVISKKITDKALRDYPMLRRYPKGSLVIAMYGATIGKLGVLDFDAFTNQACCVFGISEIVQTRYFYFTLLGFRSQIISLAYGGGQPNISQDLIKNLRFPIPSLQEQTAIANFLDEKTAKIDQAIAQKEKLIALLKERKQIMIQELVTGKKVWNGTTWAKPEKTKDSGVEWIGEIPEEWEVKRLKFLLSSKLQYGANESGVEYDENLPRYIRITDFGSDGKLSENNKLSLTASQSSGYLLKDGDILFARSGATVGKSYQFKSSMSTEKNYAFAGYLIKAEADSKKITSDYLYLYTSSPLFTRWKDSIFIKATIENIGADKYANLIVVLPPIDEQSTILEYTKLQFLKFDQSILLQEKQIEKLREYKSVLIDSAVTGKIKVSKV